MAHGQFNRSSHAYEKYKANLNAFFDGKRKLPEHLKQLMPEEESAQEKPQAQKQSNRPLRRRSAAPLFSYEIFLEAIKRSVTPDEVTRTIDALLESGHQIPRDEDILSKAFIHRDESVVLKMLEKLSELLESKPSRNPRLLKTRLENLVLISSGSDIRDGVSQLLSKLS